MAGVTICRESFKHSIFMARGTVNRLMRTKKRERCFLMIEGRRCPTIKRMACQTIMIEPGCLMIRRSCLVVDLLMTGKTIARQSRIAVIRVTRDTLDGLVSADELIICLRMLKDRRQPSVQCVARRAIL